MKRLTIPLGALGLSLALGACSAAPASTEATGGTSVVTSFYPIEFAAERISGGKADVSVLTKPGAEPHDLELGAQDLARMTNASLVVYAKGFQPAVDEGVEQVDAAHVLDVSGAASLTLESTEHEGEGAEEHADHAAGNDPHFWLDPQRYAAVASAIGARLAQDDPANAATYETNTKAFVAELTTLDTEFRTKLASCRIKELVTSHAAFGYLAQRYGFSQRGITGISPEAEPSAAGLQAITDLVRTSGVTTIYQETLVEAHFAETVASSTGVAVATLDPVEGINDKSMGKDYFEVMRSNLAALVKGQGCS